MKPWPWIIVGFLFFSMIACLSMVIIAIHNPPEVIEGAQDWKKDK